MEHCDTQRPQNTNGNPPTWELPTYQKLDPKEERDGRRPRLRNQKENHDTRSMVRRYPYEGRPGGTQTHQQRTRGCSTERVGSPTQETSRRQTNRKEEPRGN